MQTAIDALNKSVTNGWTGVFPEKINKQPPKSSGRHFNHDADYNKKSKIWKEQSE